jgi:hypothetical protein
MSLTKASYSMITGAPVNVLDCGADATGVADSTAAFTLAQTISKNVFVPPGSYSIDNLRIQSEVNLIGAGKGNTILRQRTAGNPAINCTSDVTTGQLFQLNLNNFSVVGNASATVTAVRVGASSPYVVTRSSFDFEVSNCFRALEIIGSDAQNVYLCDFTIYSSVTSNTAIVITGGTYNTYDFTGNSCLNGRGLSATGFNCTFTRCVFEGQIASSGQNDVFINPTIEEWTGTALPLEAAFNLSGFNQNLIDPTLILNTANSAKVGAAFQPYSQTILTNPRILVDSAVLATPCFATPQKWTLIGPGQNTCTNKLEAVYTGIDANRDLRNVALLGDCSSFSARSTPHGGKTVQYVTDAGGYNITALNNTDALILDYAGTVAVVNLNLSVVGSPPLNNQTISIYSKSIITSLAVASPPGSDVTLFPSTLAAGGKFSAVYYSTTNKWYPT